MVKVETKMLILSRILFYGGVFLIIIGAVIMYNPHVFSWFGKLPGDIRIENPKLSFYMPITSMLILSVAFSLGTYLLARIFGR